MSCSDFTINNENPLNKNHHSNNNKLSKSLSIDNIRVNQTKIRINSPKSLHAMRQLGYNISDLEYLPFKEYIRNNPYLMSKPKKSQEKIFTKIEKIRNNRFQKLKELRNKLISHYSNDKNATNISSCSLYKNTPKKMNISMTNSVDIFYGGTNPMQKGRKILDKIIYKNKTEFYNKIQFELNNELIKKKNEDKVQKENMRYQNYKLELSRRKKEEETLKAQRELELKKKQEEHEQMIKKLYKEKYEEGIQKAKEEEKLEKQRRKEVELKWLADQYRKDLFHKKLQERLDDKQLQILAKAKLLELRESNKRKQLELKNKELQEINMKKSREKKEHIELTLKNNEMIKEEMRKQYELKEKEHEEKEKRFMNKNRIENEKKFADYQRKHEEMLLILERNKLIQQQKINNYYEKQKNLEIKREIGEKRRVIQNLERQREKEENEQKIKNVLQKNQQILTQKKNKILSAIKTRDYLTQIRWEKKREENEKMEELNLEKQIVKGCKLKELEQQKLNMINDSKMKMHERDKKIEQFLMEKSIINEQKKIIADEIERQKKLYSSKVKNLVDNNIINKKLFNQIKKTFSSNQQISSVINKFDQLIEN